MEYLSDPVQIIYNFSDGTTRAYKWKDTTNSNIFITIVGESRLEENNKTFLHRMGVLLGINVVMLIALLALTAYINYSPLRRLVTRISPGNSEKNMSEFEQIEQVIQELDNRASDQGVVIMDYVLNDLLYGKITRQPELEQLIPNFHFRYFCSRFRDLQPPHFRSGPADRRASRTEMRLPHLHYRHSQQGLFPLRLSFQKSVGSGKAVRCDLRSGLQCDG